MCGRYAFYLDPKKLKSFFGLENLLNLPQKDWARYNCAPCQTLPLVVKNRIGLARWGFRPEWSRQDDLSAASKMINARSETVSEKPSFRESWARGRRCIIPVSGFYEWAKAGNGGKQPYFIRHRDTEILCLAGLWSKVDGQVTFTILTKAADSGIAQLHSRMPIMIEAERLAQWFDGSVHDANALIDYSTGRHCRYHAVSNDVGKITNDHADLVKPVEVA